MNAQAQTRHTRGPWIVRTIDRSLGTIDTADGAIQVAQAQQVSVADQNDGSPERQANAVLIAAAPEQHEALLKALASLECEKAAKLPVANSALRDAAIFSVRAAIAKATGAA